jgi:Subtilase family
MVRKSVAVLFVFIYFSSVTAQAQNNFDTTCEKLFPDPSASYVEPPIEIDDPVVPELDTKDGTFAPRPYSNVGAQSTHGVQRLRLLHNVDGRESVVGIFDQGAVYGDHYQFLDEKLRSTRVQPLWSRPGQQGFFGDKPTCKRDKAIPSAPDDQQPYYCYSKHSTHIAGTVASAGFADRDAHSAGSEKPAPQNSQGMAPRIGIYSFDWNRAAYKLCRVATKGRGFLPVYVSNHSYGPRLGWELRCTDPNHTCSEVTWTWYGGAGNTKDDDFGNYNYAGWAEEFDRLVMNRRDLSVFRAAGNSHPDPTIRGWWNKPTIKKRYKIGDKGAVSSQLPSPTPRNGEYKLVSGSALAKNVITIGAIERIFENEDDPGASNPDSITSDKVIVTDFSSWGPRRNGAIKPDLVAAGLYLHSPTISEDEIIIGKIDPKERNNYEDLSGTSMATPVAAGIGALLNEVALHKLQRVLRADEMKAILIHTAINNSKDNKIDIDAPNPETGWGSIRADYAGYILDPETATRNGVRLKKTRWIDTYERTFPGGFLVKQDAAKTNFSMSLEHIPGADVRVTLAWLDEPGENLVDDLDLEVRGPTNTQHKVWCLDDTKQADRCERNDKDNVERVDVKAGVEPNGGTWTIEVKHVRGPHKTVPFAMVISGLRRRGLPPPPQTIPPDLPPDGPIGEPPTIPQEPSRYCHACWDIPLRDAPYNGSPSRINVWKCDPVHIVGYDPSRPSWVKVTFEFPPFKGMGGFPEFSPGGPVPWNRGWAKRSEIACRGDGHWCPCD